MGVTTSKYSDLGTTSRTKFLVHLATKSSSTFRVQDYELPGAFPRGLVVRQDRQVKRLRTA